MYKCFEPIPVEVRQKAYDKIVEAHQEYQRRYGYRRYSLWITMQNDDGVVYDYCPLGVVNWALGLAPTSADGNNGRIPGNGGAERELLAEAGYAISAPSASRFIHAVDGSRICTAKELAAAMGVEPKEW